MKHPAWAAPRCLIPDRSSPCPGRAASPTPACAGTRSAGSGWSSRRPARTARSSRRPASAHSTRPGRDGLDRDPRPPTTTWSCSRTVSPPSAARGTGLPDAAAGGADPDFPQRSLTAAAPLGIRAAGAQGGRPTAAARWSASPPITTGRSHRPEPRSGPGRSWRRGPTGPRSSAAWPGSPRCTASRTGARRSGSPCTAGDGQTYGFPFLTPRTATMLPRGEAVRGAGPGEPVRRPGRRGDRQAGTRIVARNEHWTAFVPAAARWPFEVQLFPAQAGAGHPRAG